MDLTEKKKIGKYETTGILGRGGMGVVYRAEDKRIGRQVAIKTLTEGFSGQPEMLERFYREAQAGILQHPNIVTVYDLGDEDGVPFIVMEFVSGEPMDKLISSGRQLLLIDKLSIIEQVCNALGYAHHRGVIHRDIKPANVMVQPDGTAKIVDFGIARVQSSGPEGGLTRTGNVIGTVHYIAPERLKGLPFDGRSDIFATGVMLYLLLTGQLPFAGEDMAVLQKLVNEPHPPLSTWLASYPPALDGIIDRALAKDPEQRYATAEDFASDLHALIEELKKGQITELFSDAERLTAEQQFGRAREVLLQIVRISPQHTQARQLLGIVQQNLARLQRAEQVRQLVAEAEQAIAALRFTEALGSLDQAIKLDPENEQLKAKLEETKEKKRRNDELGILISQADSLRERGDWTGALKVVEKALSLSQTDSRIRTIHAEVSRQAKIAAQQGQIREMLGMARQEVAARQFTAAIEILREVGKIDPSQPEMESILQEALTGQEQERRRKLIEQIQAEIENSLAAEDYERATQLIDRAVAQLPSESSLLQLKTRVGVLTREYRNRKLIDSAAARAQEAFANSPGEALLIVQKALQEMPGEERLLALEDSLRRRLKAAEKEETRSRYLREAQQAIDHSQFDKAVEVLESYQAEFNDAAGVEDLLQFAREELDQQQRRERIATCVNRARQLMEQGLFDQAIGLIEPVRAKTQDPKLERLLGEARAQREDAARKAEAMTARIAKLRERGQLDEAIDQLQKIPGATTAGTQLNALLVELEAERKNKQAMATAIAAAQQALESGNFAAAVEPLESVRRAFGDSAALTRAIDEIASRRAQLANAAVAKSVEAARAALLANDAAAARQELRSSAPLFEFAGTTQQTDWRRLNAEATKPAATRVSGVVPKVVSETEVAAQAEGKPPRKLLIPILGGCVVLALIAGAALWFRQQGAKPAAQPTQASQSSTPASPPPAAAPPTGTLLIQGNTDGVEVFVDGPIKGFTQSDGTLKLPLDPGTHTVRFVKPGYADSPPATVTLTANAETPLRFSLTRNAASTAPVDTSAFLTVHSRPGAQVNVDHVPQGSTDSRGDLMVQVKPGSHLIETGLGGFQSFSQQMTFKPSERLELVASLVAVAAPPKPATPTPAPAPPPPAPTQITSFSASAAEIEQGQPTTLRWQTANATEVALDNGIGGVDGSGETQVRPQANTTYVLTAKGNGGVQQRSVNIVVEPKPQAPVNTAPRAPNDNVLVKVVIDNFNLALSTHDVPRMQMMWAGMKPAQAKDLQSFFKGNPTAKISDDCSPSALSVMGDSASWACTETTTLIANGKPLTTAHAIHYTFARKGGVWSIVDRR